MAEDNKELSITNLTQLYRDIERHNLPISDFNFTELANANPTFYGEPNSLRRKKFSSQFLHLKTKIKPTKYIQFIKDLGVEPLDKTKMWLLNQDSIQNTVVDQEDKEDKEDKDNKEPVITPLKPQQATPIMSLVKPAHAVSESVSNETPVKVTLVPALSLTPSKPTGVSTPFQKTLANATVISHKFLAVVDDWDKDAPVGSKMNPHIIAVDSKNREQFFF